MKFPWEILSEEDFMTACMLLGDDLRDPDLVIAPDGTPYIYRWHIIPRSTKVNVYFHIQVASDPERPLHDHPWDNTSVILSGGYLELLSNPPGFEQSTLYRKPGDVIYRRAEQAHRLLLPSELSYTMSLFTTGPKRREWGFWYPTGWRSFKEVTIETDGVSVHKKETM